MESEKRSVEDDYTAKEEDSQVVDYYKQKYECDWQDTSERGRQNWRQRLPPVRIASKTRIEPW